MSFFNSPERKKERSIRLAVSMFQIYVKDALGEERNDERDALQALESNYQYLLKRGYNQTTALIMICVGCFHHFKDILNEQNFYDFCKKDGAITKDGNVTCTAQEMYELFKKLIIT